MTLGIIEGLETPARTVKNYILTENKENGLLFDVETILTSHKSKTPATTPCVWIVEHPAVADDLKKSNLSHVNFLRSTFEFVCVEYDPDPDIASDKAKNLATRVGASILKNFNRLKESPEDPDRIFQSIRFNTLIPDGEVNIQGKSDTVPAAAILFDFVYPINWLKCINE